MKNKFCLYLFVLIMSGVNSINSQKIENIKIKENDEYAWHLSFRDIFGTYNKTILFRTQDFSGISEFPRMADQYYVLDSDSNKIDDISFRDSNYVPLAFLNNDTIVLKFSPKNEWIFFSKSQNKYIDEVPKSLKAFLEIIPPGIDENKYVIKFEKSLDKMLLFENSYTPILGIYNYNKCKGVVEKQDFNIGKFCKDCAILNAYWINSTQLILVLFNSETQLYNYCSYDIVNNQIVKMDFFDKDCLLDDVFGNYCLVRIIDSKPYQAAIYEIDIKSMKFILKYQIFAKVSDYNPLYRLGFVSPSKIARMTTSEFDYTSFEPYLNQIKNLIDISVVEID